MHTNKLRFNCLGPKWPKHISIRLWWTFNKIFCSPTIFYSTSKNTDAIKGSQMPFKSDDLPMIVFGSKARGLFCSSHDLQVILISVHIVAGVSNIFPVDSLKIFSSRYHAQQNSDWLGSKIVVISEVFDNHSVVLSRARIHVGPLHARPSAKIPTRCRVVFLRSFISALFLYFFQLLP